MTLIIGIRCKDGIVMAADSMSTEVNSSGEYITKHETEKLVLQPPFLWGAAGSVGVRQVIEETIKNFLGKFTDASKSATFIRQQLVEVLQPVVRRQYTLVAEASGGKTGIPQTDYIFGLCLRDGFHLLGIEWNMNGEVIQACHCAIGSGMKTGQALLRRLRAKEWDLKTACVVAYRTMNDAIHVEPAGIGPPIRLARLFLEGTKPKMEMIDGDELDSIRDTAMAWTSMEKEVLDGLQKPKEEVPPAVPPSPAA